MNYFVTYGDENFTESVNIIKRQAKSLGLFSKIISYSPKDLPLYIKASPLFSFKKGGGYWVWKPYIIIDILSKCQEGDVVYYVDSGCSLKPNFEEWSRYAQLIEKYNAIFFQYRDDFKYHTWDKYCKDKTCNSPKIKYWIKKTTSNYFTNYLGNDAFLNYNKIMGGFFIIQKTNKQLHTIDNWYKITLLHPELIIDPYGEELSEQEVYFNAHRHDQTILTPLIFNYKEEDKIMVLPESAESNQSEAAVIASRNKVGKLPFLLKLKYRIYYSIGIK